MTLTFTITWHGVLVVGGVIAAAVALMAVGFFLCVWAITPRGPWWL
jgi:hypothetical protein